MNEIKEIGIDACGLESVLFEMECGLNALDAVHFAIENSPNDPREYADALYCVHDYLMERERTAKAIACGSVESGAKKAGGVA